MPMDLYFYEYAKQLHKIKWTLYQNRENHTKTAEILNNLELNLPTVIDGCKSTRFILSCPKEKLQYHWRIQDDEINRQQLKLFHEMWR